MKIKKTIPFISILFILFGCNKTNIDSTKEEKPLNLNGVFTSNDFLHASNTSIVNKKDNEVILKGINAGGYLQLEPWMSAVKSTSIDNGQYNDHLTVTKTFENRFGKEKTVELWQYYRNNFFTENDFKYCKDMNMNVIRLPFTYMSLDPNYSNVDSIDNEEYNFTILDEFISKAAENNMYIILDMHGAYGSQNGQDHSGESLSLEQVDFYTNKEKKEKTKHLWSLIAQKYKDVPTIAGYDLLNEPGEKAKPTTKVHWNYMDELYKEIRKVDKNHMIIFESCWDGVNLPNPLDYKWENCMYSFHNYCGNVSTDEILHSMEEKIKGVEEQNFNVPLYMGEFTCYGKEDSWKKVLSLFDEKRWSYTPWTYKINRNNDTSYQGWGVFYSKAENVDPLNDSIDEIKRKWYMVDTDYDTTSKMKFESLNTLYDLLKSNYKNK